MDNHSVIFDEIVNNRRSYRLFDTNYILPKEVVQKSLERAIKSPNSSNMQLWEFYRVKSRKSVEEVAKICLSQRGAVTASEIVVFVVRPDLWKKRQRVHLARIDKSQNNIDNTRLFTTSEYDYYAKLIPIFYNNSFSFFKDIYKRIIVWFKGRNKPFVQDVYSKFVPIVAHKSTALAAQTFMLSITAEGYASVPMEGLDSKRMKKFLNLPKEAQINMAIAVGKGLEEGLRGERIRLPYNEVVFDV